MEMELRDYFAGQALAGMIAHSGFELYGYSDLADEAYSYADAMLKARERDTETRLKEMRANESTETEPPTIAGADQEITSG